MFLKVGSILLWKEDWLSGATSVGKITEGTFFRVMRYDSRCFYIQRCSSKGIIHKNSYVRSFNKDWLMSKVEILNDS